MNKLSSVIRAVAIFVVAEIILNLTQIVTSIVYQNILVVRYTGAGIDDQNEILEKLATELGSAHYFTMLSLVSISVMAMIYGIHYWIYYYEKGNRVLKKYTSSVHIVTTIFAIIGIVLATCSYCLYTSNDTMSFRKEFLSIQNLSFTIGTLGIIVELLLLPIAQEALFRGVIFNRLNKSISVSSAILIQAILCGMFQLNVKKGIYSFFLSMLLGFMMAEKNSVLYCIRVRIYITISSFFVWKCWNHVIPVNPATGVIFTVATVLVLGADLYIVLRKKNLRRKD